MRNPVIIDTSIVIKWVVEESDSAAAIALLIKWFNEETPIIGPTLLAYEVANVLHQRVRKGSITAGEAEQRIIYLLQNVLEIDETKDAAFNVRAMQLANLYGLSAVYDAHYLVLAERKGYEFWTADIRLLTAIKGKLPWVHALSEAS
jgi:predicted nucleic acid-binding protein